jgi:hypothetical protein
MIKIFFSLLCDSVNSTWAWFGQASCPAGGETVTSMSFYSQSMVSMAVRHGSGPDGMISALSAGTNTGMSTGYTHFCCAALLCFPEQPVLPILPPHFFFLAAVGLVVWPLMWFQIPAVRPSSMCVWATRARAFTGFGCDLEFHNWPKRSRSRMLGFLVTPVPLLFAGVAC